MFTAFTNVKLEYFEYFGFERDNNNSYLPVRVIVFAWPRKCLCSVDTRFTSRLPSYDYECCWLMSSLHEKAIRRVRRYTRNEKSLKVSSDV